MSNLRVKYFNESSYKKINIGGLLEGYKFYLCINNKVNSYENQLRYINCNIRRQEYSLYGVYTIEELIKLLAKLYEDELILIRGLNEFK
ncbi:hypothetical protein SOI81_11040 [Acinetobacter pittii]|jgi:hypothetical protein|uniref:hypothetical protein n=1 Tax=Acinetobacter pittii TaxID=48296 RepID=UPI002A6A86F3|nr:hypothetical protein [Acinetobacter pittii]WPP68917.1 hypothetical protein SOI81_11040 [Acinetobacter pittii]